jgi:cytoskeletal protein CcmA (bactofilin family)
LECDSLTIAATALVEGNVRTNALSIDMGAEVLGSISRIS